MSKIIEYIIENGKLGREISLLNLIREIDYSVEEFASDISFLYHSKKIYLSLSSGVLYPVFRHLENNINYWDNPDKLMKHNLRVAYSSGIKKAEIKKLIDILTIVKSSFPRVSYTWHFIRTRRGVKFSEDIEK